MRENKVHQGRGMIMGRVPCGRQSIYCDIASKIEDVTCIRCVAIALNNAADEQREKYEEWGAAAKEVNTLERQLLRLQGPTFSF